MLDGAKQELDKLGSAISDLMGEWGRENATRVLDSTRSCMITINELYRKVDLLHIQMETGIVERAGASINEYQTQLDTSFRTYARGEAVASREAQALAFAWMTFRETQHDLFNYIESHPEVIQDS